MIVQRVSVARMNRYLVLVTALAVTAPSFVNAADPPPDAAKDCSKIEAYKEMVVCYAENARDTETEMCLTDITMARTKELKLQLSCQEGSPGCVAPARQP